ncbi:MFSD1-like protein [Mya arenaria]|uniref:Lysosomal dipeptide transporter MFSD1 n=1 Tax=Mya arenaria TaxID=6604 RepID=A0ABY7G7A7_MYAAR|nr:MFSD1-like protein [Mya arenaria]
MDEKSPLLRREHYTDTREFAQIQTCENECQANIGKNEDHRISPDAESGSVNEEPNNEGTTCPEAKARSPSTIYRCVMLVALCLINIGDYYCFDSPAGCQDHILDDLEISQTKYMGFYSTIQWASIVSCLFGGYMTDRIGNRTCVVVSTILLLASHTMFAAGALLHSYWTMWVARALFGLIGGISAISSDNLTVKWYKMNVLNMVMGLRTSIARVSSVMALNVLGPLYNVMTNFSSSNVSLGLTLLSGSFVCSVSALAAIVFALLDRRADKRTMKVAAKESDAKEDLETIKLSEIKEFPATFWLISFTAAVYYLQLFPFIAQGQVFMETKYERHPNSADNINRMFTVIAVGQSGVTYLVGYIVDTTGFFMLEFFFLMSVTNGQLNNSTRKRNMDKDKESLLEPETRRLIVNETMEN